MTDELDKLRADVGWLADALRPFADLCADVDAVGAEGTPDDFIVAGNLTVGHFRNARAALRCIERGEGE